MTTTAEAKPVAINYGCPDWCERTDHHADVVDQGNPPRHYGPDFGAVYVEGDGTDTEAVVVLGAGEARAANPAELREVAANMVRAAEWLEAHQ